MLENLDVLLDGFDRISCKETGPVIADELKRDLIAFRDSLAEFTAASIRFSLTLPANVPMPLSELLTTLTSRDVPQARITIVSSIALLEMSIIKTRIPVQQQLNSIATIAAIGLAGDGMIERLKMTREVIKSFFEMPFNNMLLEGT